MPDSTDPIDATHPSAAGERTWIPFAEQPAKRKRAEAVCVPCHRRKVKCDVQARKQSGHERCSNCDSAQRQCELRTSQRGKRRRSRGESVSIQRCDGPAADEHGRSTRSDRSVAGGAVAANNTVAEPPRSLTACNRPSQAQQDNASILGQTFTPLGSIEGVTSHRSHENDVDAGFLQVYGPENQFDAEMQELQAQLQPAQEDGDPLSQDKSLQATYLETYWEHCYCFCPVLEPETASAEISRSPMLLNALALAASHVQPPLLPHDGPQTYYDRARRLFYDDHEANNLLALKALSLFYWWAPRAPSTIHRHTSWWWQSVIIRHAQAMGMHREPAPDNPRYSQLNLSLHRRIWWTAYARERLTALCQSKPCIIDEEDCTISFPSLSDFPDTPWCQRKGQIFIHWVYLCRILGRMAKSSNRAGSNFYAGAEGDLAEWITSLPSDILLRLDSGGSSTFDADIYQLHLPYLTAVTVLHLRRSAHDLPQALPPAILAASCTAKILRNVLARGNARFMMAITCWYSGTAFIALLQGSRIQQFAKEAEDGLSVLYAMVEQLQKMWPSANVIRQGFDRLRSNAPSAVADPMHPSQLRNEEQRSADNQVGAGLNANQGLSEEVDWTRLLPFANAGSVKIAECLRRNKESGNVTRGMPSPTNTFFYENVMNEYNDFLDPLFADYQADFSDLSLFQV